MTDINACLARYLCRRDKAAWLGEMQDRKIGFFKSEFVEEILDYDNMDGM